MSIHEQWQTWRDAQASSDTVARVKVDDYLAWLDQFTSEQEDPEHLFVSWRAFPEHKALLKRLIAGEVLPFGTGPQMLAGLFYALYFVLNGKKVVISTSMFVDMVRLRAICAHLGKLSKLNIRIMGTFLDTGRVYLGDCQNVDIVIADFFELMASQRKNPQQFDQIVQQLFVLEFDLALYNTRLLLFDRDVECAAGMVYKASKELPEQWKNANQFIDIPSMLKEKEHLALAGCYSSSTAYTIKEIKQLLGSKLQQKIPLHTSDGCTCFTYRTHQERIAMLVNDVMQTPGNALIICSTDQLRHDLQEEFRKAGQPCTNTARSVDIATFFSPLGTADKQRKVLVMRGLPSAMTLPDHPLCDGAIFLAETFVSYNMHEKCFTYAQGLFHQTHQPRVYFSLEDQMFTLYDEAGGFHRLFQLIDFTETYDHWRQIRRVLAKAMLSKLHKLRIKSLDETAPLITMALNVHTNKAPKPKPGRKSMASRQDAPCFCGSGKTFRECHGKKLA